MAGYFGTTVTLAANNTNYSIYSLVQAANNKVPNKCCELQVQSTSNNTWVGDNSMNATLFGSAVAANATVVFRTQLNTLSLKEIFLRMDAATRTARITVITA